MPDADRHGSTDIAEGGMLVKQNATSLSNLREGVYVVDGKKLIVK